MYLQMLKRSRRSASDTILRQITTRWAIEEQTARNLTTRFHCARTLWRIRRLVTLESRYHVNLRLTRQSVELAARRSFSRSGNNKRAYVWGSDPPSTWQRS